MPINRKGGGNSRESRIADALINQPDPKTGKTKGGPFGKFDQMAVTVGRGILRKSVTVAAAERVLQGKNAGADKPVRRRSR